MSKFPVHYKFYWIFKIRVKDQSKNSALLAIQNSSNNQGYVNSIWLVTQYLILQFWAARKSNWRRKHLRHPWKIQGVLKITNHQGYWIALHTSWPWLNYWLARAIMRNIALKKWSHDLYWSLTHFFACSVYFLYSTHSW